MEQIEARNNDGAAANDDGTPAAEDAKQSTETNGSKTSSGLQSKYASAFSNLSAMMAQRCLPAFGKPRVPCLGQDEEKQDDECKKTVERLLIDIDKLQKPNGTMKRFFWTAVEPSLIPETIFSKFENLGDILKEMPCDTLETCFHAKEQAVKNLQVRRNNQKQEKKSFISSAESKDIGLFLCQFKEMTKQDVVAALQRFDVKVFTLDKLRMLKKKCILSKEKMKSIHQFLADPNNSPEMLGEAEQFVLELEKVQNLGEKLTAFETIVSFREKMDNLKNSISIIDEACKEALKSKGLVKIFEYILMFGNFINSGTNRGRTPGFKLDALKKLSDFKTTDNTQNLLQFLIEFIRDHHSDLLLFSDEIPNVIQVRTIEVDKLQDNVNGLVASVKNVEAFMKSMSQSGVPDNEPFVNAMIEFVERANGEIRSFDKQYNQTMERLKVIMKFFGEDAPDPDEPIDPEDPPGPGRPFRLINDFIITWEKNNEEIARRARLAEAEARLSAQRKANVAAQANKCVNEQNQTGIVDSVNPTAHLITQAKKRGSTQRPTTEDDE